MSTIQHAVSTALRAAALDTRTRRSAAWAATAMMMGLTGVTYGQTPAPAESADNQTLDEVTVTGSRIRRTTDFDTANPTTVVDATYLENLGIVNVGKAISQLPTNVSNNTPATTGNANFFAGSTIANLRGLNPFFGSRTLNLVNNRRFVPTNQGDGVDLNFIPSVLIERVDVVTGGASAAYGSGAISGVNNIFLNRKLEGGKVEIDFYQTGESDGDDKHAGLAYGTALGDRAHMVLGFEYQDSEAVGCLRARDWCAEGKAFYQGVGAGVPSLVLGSNVRVSQISNTGVFQNFNPGATSALQSNAAGTALVPFALPAAPYNTVLPFGTVYVPGGDGPSAYEFTNLRAPVERKVATGVFSFELTDTINLDVDLSWGEVETTNITGGLDANFIGIAGDNAYALAAPAIAAFLAAPGPEFLNKSWNSQINSHSVFTTEVKRAAVGLDGGFGSSSWKWDAYVQFGETDREQLVADNRHLNAYLMAIDAVAGPGGQVMCRVTRDGFANVVAANPAVAYATADPRIAQGCVPLNPFGNQAISQAAHDYSFGFLRENLNYKQNVFAANATGDLFEGFGAGAIQAAVGLEYRTEKGENVAAEELDDWDRTDFLIQYGESFSGDVDVTEGFVEFNVPFLRDAPGAKRLELNLAARESRYENQGKDGTTGEKRSHNMFTWKASAFYDPVDWLRIRGSRSRDSRAANFRELYYGQKIQAGGVFGFCGTAPGTDACNWSLEGNVNLVPEKADTTTFGIVLKPLENLQFAADFFRIEISDAIQQASIQRVLAGCRGGLAEFCSLITTATPGDLSNITDIRALAFNGSGYEYKGVDVTSSYQWQINDANSLTFRLLATKMMDQNFQPNPTDPFINVVGQTGTGNSFLSDNQPTAELIANLMATWNLGPASLTGQVRYVSDGVMDYRGVALGDPCLAGAASNATCRSVSTNRVPSYTVFSLNGSYRFEGVGPLSTLQVYASVDNLFDKDPPVAVGGGAFGPSNVNGGTNAVFFDTMGRAFRIGVRSTF
jgi:iron complex outermembrane receptor protein